MSTFSFLSRLASLEPKVEILEAQLPAKTKHHYQDPHIVERLSYHFFLHLRKLNPDLSRPLVVISIGTDRSTGDSLGPLVGTKLSALAKGLHIYGTLDEPVHASNLAGKLEEVHSKYRNPLVVAIDACLGQSDSVGSISLALGALKPGAGVHKNLPEVGEIHFTGIVNVGGYMEYFVLQNTRLSLVWKMAELIAASIEHGVQLAQVHFLKSLSLAGKS